MPQHWSPGDWGSVDWWRQVAKPWVPAPAFNESLTASMSRMADVLGFSPGTVLQDIVETVAKRLVGRPVDIRFGSGRVHLVVRRTRVDPPDAGPMVGQLGNVEFDAGDVEWSNHRIDHLSIVARNVHVSVGNPNAIVAAPILFTATFGDRTVADAVAQVQPRARVRLLSETLARVRLTDREQWGHIDVEPRVDGTTLELQPRAIALRNHRLLHRGLDRIPATRVRLRLPPGVVLEDVSIVEGSLVVHGTLREWREPVSATQLGEVVNRLRAFAGRVLDLPRLAP